MKIKIFIIISIFLIIACGKNDESTNNEGNKRSITDISSANIPANTKAIFSTQNKVDRLSEDQKTPINLYAIDTMGTINELTVLSSEGKKLFLEVNEISAINDTKIKLRLRGAYDKDNESYFVPHFVILNKTNKKLYYTDFLLESPYAKLYSQKNVLYAVTNKSIYHIEDNFEYKEIFKLKDMIESHHTLVFDEGILFYNNGNYTLASKNSDPVNIEVNDISLGYNTEFPIHRNYIFRNQNGEYIQYRVSEDTDDLFKLESSKLKLNITSNKLEQDVITTFNTIEITKMPLQDNNILDLRKHNRIIYGTFFILINADGSMEKTDWTLDKKLKEENRELDSVIVSKFGAIYLDKTSKTTKILKYNDTTEDLITGDFIITDLYLLDNDLIYVKQDMNVLTTHKVNINTKSDKQISSKELKIGQFATLN